VSKKKSNKNSEQNVKNPDNKASNNSEQEEFNIVKELIGMLIYIVVVIIVVWFIVHFVGQRTEVSGESMYDTLEDGDNLWIDKLSYRFKDPKRFDIVVFPYQDSDVYYIKRVIGLPGEKVRIGDDGTIFINDEALEEDYGYETIMPDRIGRAADTITLGEDEYFVMGDNRNNSKDSRFESVGNISKDELIGKAVLRMWPLSKFGTID
jgi:signal peptidase I